MKVQAKKSDGIIARIKIYAKHILAAQPMLSVSASIYLSVLLFVLLILAVIIISSIYSLQQENYIQKRQEQFNYFTVTVISYGKTEVSYLKSKTDENEQIVLAALAFVNDDGNSLFVLNDDGKVINSYGNLLDSKEVELYSKKLLDTGKFNESITYHLDKSIVLFYRSNLGFHILGVVPHVNMSLWRLSWQPVLEFAMLILLIFILSVWFYMRYINTPLIRLNKLMVKLFSGGKDASLNNFSGMNLSGDMGFLTEKVQEVLDREYNIRLMLKQAELDTLQSQINPHFLYNTLETIRGLALSDNNIHIAKMTKALSSFFRYNISTSNSMVSVADEIRNVCNYFIILQYRFDDRYSLEVDFGEDSELILNCTIPKLSIQPIVENAIKHGLEKRVGKGIVFVSGYMTRNMLIITIEDNGVGMDIEQLSKLNEKLKNSNANPQEDKQGLEDSGTGIAITNVNKRLRLTYGEFYGVSIFSTENIGTRVEITIPL